MRRGLYPSLVRPLLFRLDAERAHDLTLRGLAVAAPALARLRRPPDGGGRLRQEILGLSVPNPVGLAAGVDKGARTLPAWPALGFGFAEVGTITLHAQPGNPRPRMHRLPADRALINSLGFNNAGAEAAAATLGRWRRRGLLGRAPLGVNLGKSKVTPPEDAPADYAASLDLLWGFADYVTVNVSSPNTPGLRDLQAVGPLAAILDAIDEVAARKVAGRAGAPPPVLVKIAPDLADEDVDAVVDLALHRGLSGLIVANTTLRRDGLRSSSALTALPGGLSGPPLHDHANRLVGRVARRAGAAAAAVTDGGLIVIGVGGVSDADDAWAMLAAGASLVQLYTGLVYGGPGTARRICAGLLARMDREGVGHVSEIVGSSLPR